MIGTGWLLVLAAWADEPAPAPEPAADADEEIVVYGELQVEQARQQVIQDLAELGFTDEVTRLGDRTIYRTAARRGRGRWCCSTTAGCGVKRQPLRVEGRPMPWAKLDSPGAWLGCLVWPWLCVRTTGATFGHRKWLAHEGRTVEALHADVETWGDRIADLATDRTVAALGPRLEALWEHGVPLGGSGPPLATMADRRSELLSFYASRTDTVWGEEVRDAVGGFCRAVVQHSDDPFTDAELRDFAERYPGLPSPLTPRAGVED
ncbi:MAG: hypothetical protein H6738_06445 [Alphaproteobacteria bacterium]|nr:hypothetical protein [Alphaproteobacteria bacterium]